MIAAGPTGGSNVALEPYKDWIQVTNTISVYLNAAVQGFVIIVVAVMQRRRK